MSFRAEIPGTVDLFDLHRRSPEIYPFLLQSVAGHPQSGRYDILFAFPQEHVQIERRSCDGGNPEPVPQQDFFSALSRQFTEQEPLPQSDLPFCGGWFLLLGYEAARLIEPRLRLPDSPYRLPDALAVRCTAAAIYDRTRQVTHLIAETEKNQLEQLHSDLQFHLKSTAQYIDKKINSSFEEEREEDFLGGVERIHQYLRAGDVFQVNLSRAWRAELLQGSNYQDVYAGLCRHNPAPFAGLAYWQGSAVLSSSPERLVSLDNGIVQTRPIAGTRPRGAGPTQDQALRQKLIGNLKERAEHVMLIDLERNDLGRICEPGSVEVSELMTVESYAHVHHIVSNVRGRLRQGVGPGEVLRAVFPGGTITGCPKVRAMEIISELEGIGRGPYTGAMGYLSRCGRMDTNILIRSLVCEDGAVSFRAGAGIVADSQPQAELEETRAKARGLLLALGAAV
ncbi:MAG: aminodeoxychorismate synthase component I [Stenotrophobium sp.]